MLTAFLFGCTGNKSNSAQAVESQNPAQADCCSTTPQGPEAPDFTLNDINGKPLTLSSLRGKYVVLDFWGSWCIWCIKGMPKMKILVTSIWKQAH